jgi:hypothetical protein
MLKTTPQLKITNYEQHPQSDRPPPPLLSHLNHFSSAQSTSLRSGFPNRFILDPLCSKALIILVLLLQIAFGSQNLRDQIPDKSLIRFFLPFSISLITLIFSSTPKTFRSIVTVAMLLRQQSAVAAGIAVETYRETLRAK